MSSDRSKLRDLIAADECVYVPGCYDPLTALLIQRAGYPAVYLSAWSVHVAQFGLPHLGIVTLKEYCDLAGRITNVIDIPLIVDVEHGMGGPLEVRRVVEELERVGVAAVSISDQTRGMGWMISDVQTDFVSDEQMTRKLGAAKAAQSDPDFVVIGRTDATRISADEGLRRCNAWLEAGADVAMPMMSPWLGFRGNKAPQEELHGVIRHFVADVSGPVAVHNAYGLDLSLEDANKLGLAVYIIPQACLGYSTTASARALAALRDGNVQAFAEIIPPFTNDEFGEVLDFSSHAEFVKQFGI